MVPEFTGTAPDPENLCGDAEADRANAARITRLSALSDALRSFRFRYVDAEVEEARRRLANHIDHALVPRLRDLDGPMLVAVVGQSGAGKSTLVNSLAHRAVTAAGTLRPTTATLVAWAGDRRPVPLDRLMERMPGSVVDDGRPPPEGLVIVDTPEPAAAAGDESMAYAALDAADLCVFVASSTRYADAAGWELIDRAASQRIPVVFVLNRLPGAPEQQQELVADFARRLTDRGVVDRPDGEAVVGIAEGPRSKATDGLPHDWVTGLRKEIEAFADPATRSQVVSANVVRGLRSIEAPLAMVRGALVDETARRARLLDPLRLIVQAEVEALGHEMEGRELAGLGAGSEQFSADLAAVVARRASRIARTVAARWEDDDGVAHLVAGRPDLWSHGTGFVERMRDAIGAWSADLPALARQASGRRTLLRRNDTEVAAALARRVVDPRHQPGRRAARRLDRLPDLVAAARNLLMEAIAAELAADAGRLADAVGNDLPDGLLDRLSWEGS